MVWGFDLRFIPTQVKEVVEVPSWNFIVTTNSLGWAQTLQHSWLPIILMQGGQLQYIIMVVWYGKLANMNMSPFPTS